MKEIGRFLGPSKQPRIPDNTANRPGAKLAHIFAPVRGPFRGFDALFSVRHGTFSSPPRIKRVSRTCYRWMFQRSQKIKQIEYFFCTRTSCERARWQGKLGKPFCLSGRERPRRQMGRHRKLLPQANTWACTEKPSYLQF